MTRAVLTAAKVWVNGTEFVPGEDWQLPDRAFCPSLGVANGRWRPAGQGRSVDVEGDNISNCGGDGGRCRRVDRAQTRLVRPNCRSRSTCAIITLPPGAGLAAASTSVTTTTGNCDRPTVLASIRAISIRLNRTTFLDRFGPMRDTGAMLRRCKSLSGLS